MVFLASLEHSLLLTKNSSKCRRHVAGDCFKLSTISRVFYLTGNSWRCVYILNCVLIETENWEEALFLKMLFSKKSPPIGIFCDASVLKWLKSTLLRKKVENAKQITNKEANLSEEKIKSAQKWFDMHFEVQDNSMFFHSKAVLREQQQNCIFWVRWCIWQKVLTWKMELEPRTI